LNQLWRTATAARITGERSRRLAARLLAVLLLAGILPALAATPAHAVSICQTTDANPVLPRGTFLCGDGYALLHHRYDNRWHAFLVGTDRSNTIYHTWQTTPNLGPAQAGYRQSWTSLGGSGRGLISAHNYTRNGGKALAIAVRFPDGSNYCKNYNGNKGGAWWPGPTDWVFSTPAGCVFP
jgi:hypothetical protein